MRGESVPCFVRRPLTKRRTGTPGSATPTQWVPGSSSTREEYYVRMGLPISYLLHLLDLPICRCPISHLLPTVWSQWLKGVGEGKILGRRRCCIKSKDDEFIELTYFFINRLTVYEYKVQTLRLSHKCQRTKYCVCQTKRCEYYVWYINIFAKRTLAADIEFFTHLIPDYVPYIIR